MANTLEAMNNFLKQHSILTLATTNPDGKPALDTVDYMWTGDSLYFFTNPKSRKALNIKRNSSVTAMVAEQGAQFFAAKSVEICGTAKLCEDPAKIGAYMQNVMTRRPELASVPRTPESQNNMAVYQVMPLKLRMLDNTVAPGHIDEVAL